MLSLGLLLVPIVAVFRLQPRRQTGAAEPLAVAVAAVKAESLLGHSQGLGRMMQLRGFCFLWTGEMVPSPVLQPRTMMYVYWAVLHGQCVMCDE